MRTGLFPIMALAACAGVSAPVEGGAVVYGGVETRLLDGDLVNFIVRTSGGASEDDTLAYAECAAAQYTLIRGFAFARQIRTTIQPDGAGLVADAVYTISPDLPRGSRTIDAEVTVASCDLSGIPTV